MGGCRKSPTFRLVVFCCALLSGACSGFLCVHNSVKRGGELVLHSASVDEQKESIAVNTQNDTTTSDGLSFFEVLAGNVVHCLVKSELKRDSGFDGASTGWTSWVEDSSALRLQSCMDKLSIVVPVSVNLGG